MAEARQHITRLKAPFYKSGKECGLHRYLDPDFVNRFKQDVQGGRFQDAQFSDWQNEYRHGGAGREPVLRLPLHRTFHMVCCEVVCDHGLGQPALDPRRVTSAGFVIRKLGKEGEQAWMQEDGEALGWQDAPAGPRDPDVRRRLCAKGVLHQRSDAPSYSGEEVHPLHVMNAADGAGKPHTLLYGYVPLGGFYYHRDPVAAIDAESEKSVQAAEAVSLPWPFGFRPPVPGKWLPGHVKQVDDGRPASAMFELLRLLMNRYHLGEEGIADNAALDKFCSRLWFYDTARLPAELLKLPFAGEVRDHFLKHGVLSLAAYLKACAAHGGDNPLARWIIRQEAAIDAAGGIEKAGKLEKLPASDGKGELRLSLFLLQSEAEEIRTLLGQRLRDQTLARIREIPLPKFTQQENDRYRIVPFVRYKNREGREQIEWAGEGACSIVFRVAAPFDPEASRPSLIQMPSLADLKRGLARGAAMITPGDTFNLLSSLKLNKGASPGALPGDEPGPGPGIQWICSFSLPVITLVAMILLMIMISLLNIVFFWMPWVRICLPFPKMK